MNILKKTAVSARLRASEYKTAVIIARAETALTAAGKEPALRQMYIKTQRKAAVSANLLKKEKIPDTSINEASGNIKENMTLALVKNYKESDTNISPLEMFILFSEFLKLRPSSFIIEEVAADNGSAAEKPVTQLNSKIEVLNASGFDGLAGRVAKTLKSQRFDVLKTGTYSEKVRKGKNLITVDRIEKTGIISYGNIQLAISLKEALDLGQIKVYEKKDDSKLVSVTLILGKDFKEKRK